MTTCPRQPLLSGPKSGHLIQVWLYQLITMLIWMKNKVKLMIYQNQLVSYQLTKIQIQIQNCKIW